MSELKSHARHPLFGVSLRYPVTFEDWLEEFNGTDSIDQKLGLLYRGLDARGVQHFLSKEDMKRRLLFYLELADGWTSSSNFRSPEETGLDGQSKMRCEIARKAFEALCKHFFRDVNREPGEPPSWASYVIEPEILEKICWFFRVSANGQFANIGWVETDNSSPIARKFAGELCTFAWKRGCMNHRGDYLRLQKVIDLMRKFHPALVRILWALDKLDVLTQTTGSDFGFEFPLSLSGLFALKKLAMSEVDFGHPEFGPRRKPKTLREAIAGNSPAARVLILLFEIHKGQKRAKKIMGLEEVKRIASHHLEKLRR